MAAGLAIGLSGCSSGGGGSGVQSEEYLGVPSSPRVAAHGGAMPKGGGVAKVGKPYMVAGRWYYPREQPGYDATGIASWYGRDFHGRKTANGEIYDMNRLSAAHPTLPLPSYVYVTNLANNRTLLLRVNDRGPYVGDRIIDLSGAAAKALGTSSQGLGRVRVRYAGRAPLDGDDSREQAFLRNQPWMVAGAPAHVPPVQSPRFAETMAERDAVPISASEQPASGTWSALGYRATRAR